MKTSSEQNTKRNLCDTCEKYQDYPYCTDKMNFGDGVGGDNVYECEEFKEKIDTATIGRLTEKDREEFTQSADKLAPWLLGKILCHKTPEDKVLRFRIAVTEGYRGVDADNIPIDKECYYNKYKSGKAHEASNEKPGTCFIYGGMIHFVCGTGDGGKGDNVLLRGIYEVENLSNNTFDNGNGKPCISCEIMNLKSSNQFTDLLNANSDIWIEDDKFDISENDIKHYSRINIKDDKEEWRFYIEKI